MRGICMFYPVLICLFIFISGCQSGKTEETHEAEPLTLESSILGAWENVSLTVEIKSKGGIPDSTDRFEVPAGSWESMLQIKPIRTTYKLDSTFSSVYRDLNDSIIHTTSGTWFVRKDTLFLVAEGVTTGYHTQVDGVNSTFSGYLDWDQDGSHDDLYTGVQRKVSAN